MAKKIGQGQDPALAIEFFLSGFYTHRSQLFAPFKGIGVNVVSFHDPVIDGQNMENTDLFEWSRRPGFSIFCSTALQANEVVDQFYSFRNLYGQVIPLFDSNQRLAEFSTSAITPVITKTGTGQGYITTVQNMVYFSDGTSADMLKWQSALAFPSTTNPSTWGLPAPTLTPTLFAIGDWLPFTAKVLNNAILDSNGNVEVVTKTYGGSATSGVTGANQPIWPTTTAAVIADGSLQWTNEGPLTIWQPVTAFPVPVVIVDTNGNLEFATAITTPVQAWSASTAYTVGTSVTFGGNYWTAIAASTNQPPNPGTYWVLSTNPNVTGTTAPVWNTTVGGTTVDGSYTWTNIGPGALVESFGTSYVYCYRTIYGHLSTASPVSINTGSIFGPTAATITQFSISGNIVTFTGANNFVPGNVFTVIDLTSTIGLLLNNQSFVVQSSGLSSTSFSAAFTYNAGAASGTVIDSGSTTNLIASITGIGTSSPLCNATVSITGVSNTAGVIQITAANTFVPGLQVTLSGLPGDTLGFLNGVQFEIIAVDPNYTWFQVYYTNSLGIVPANFSYPNVAGLATFNAVEIYRTSDGGGIYLFTGAVTNPSTSGATIVSYDSGFNTAGLGANSGSGTVWTNPNNVTSTVNYATVTVAAPSGGGGGGNFNAIQTCKNMASSEASLTTQAPFPLSVAPGDQIVVFVTTYDVASWTVTDSQLNTFTQIAQTSGFSFDGVVTTTVYLVSSAVGGADTITLTVVSPGGQNCFFGFEAMDCNGLNGTVETPVYATQSSGTTFNSGTIITSAANTVVFSFVWSDLQTNSGLATVVPAGYSTMGNQTVFDAADGNSYQQMTSSYQVKTALGTFSPTSTTPSNFKTLGITLALDLSLYTPSDELQATKFNFNVPAGIVPSGVQIEFDAFFSGTDGSLNVQLLKAGNAAGIVVLQALTGSVVTYTLGPSLFGATWQASDFNSTAFGVQFQGQVATGGTTGTFEVRNVRLRVQGSTSTTGWAYNDFTTDANLDELLIAPQNHLNDPPPGAPGSSVNQIVGTITAYWNGRIWMAVGNFVYYDAGPDCVNGIPEEAWPPANRFQYAGPVLNLVPTPDGSGLLVFLADRVNAIMGGPETISFYTTDAFSNFGISSPNAIFKDGNTIGLFNTQKQYWELAGGKNEVGEHIADYLTANFPPATTYATMHRNGLDVGVFLSNGTNQILRYGTNIGSWSVPAFPLGGAGALRSIETSVGVTTLMMAPPTAGTNNIVPFTNPSLGASVGSGTAWANPGNITAGVSSTYATVTISTAPAVDPSVITGFRVGVQVPSGDTLPVTIAPQTTALLVGDTIFLYCIAGVLSLTPPSITGITDTQGNTWSQLVPAQSAHLTAGGESCDIEIWSTVLTAGVPVFGTYGITPTASAPWIFGMAWPMVVRNSGGLLNYVQAAGTGTAPVSGVLTTTQRAMVISFEGGTYNFPIAPDNPPSGYTLAISQAGTGAGSSAYQVGNAGHYTDQWSISFESSTNTWASTLLAIAQAAGTTVTSQNLQASTYPLNLPVGAVVQGVEVSVTGKTTQTSAALTITPINAVAGAESDSFTLSASNTTQTFGSATDTWDMPAWATSTGINNSSFGFQIQASMDGVTGTVSISEVQVKVFYQFPPSYLLARDTTTWSDNGTYGDNNGAFYNNCYITIGSITLAQLGGPAFPLQHVVGYFDAVGSQGTQDNGGPSVPNLWILPNEVNDTQGIGFIQLPDAVPEPPIGQTQPSGSLLALRWPVNAMNAQNASQLMHHLQVKIQFNPESAPNTIKGIAFKQNQAD